MHHEQDLPSVAPLIDLARTAGEAILGVYDTDFAVHHKDDQSPLTKADMASHRILSAGLAALTPEIPLLSEESAGIPYDVRKTWHRYWLVDPLDGTKEFVKRNGEFTVNIALIEDHAPVLGVVYVPVRHLVYYGGRGIGAWRQRDSAAAEPIRVCSKREDPIRVAGSRSHAGENLQRFLERLGPYALVSIGSSLKLCLVAEGSADLYPRLGPTSEWDTAAAQAVVEAAGGWVTDTRLQPLRYNSEESVLNPHFLVFGDRATDWARYLAED